MAPVPKAVRSLTYTCWLGPWAMYVGTEKRLPVEIGGWSPVAGFTAMSPVGNEDWSSEEKGDGQVATRIAPSGSDGTTRSSNRSNRGRYDGRARLGTLMCVFSKRY